MKYTTNLQYQPYSEDHKIFSAVSKDVLFDWAESGSPSLKQEKETAYKGRGGTECMERKRGETYVVDRGKPLPPQYFSHVGTYDHGTQN